MFFSFFNYKIFTDYVFARAIKTISHFDKF